MIRILAFLLAFVYGLAHAQTANLTAFSPNGNTVTITANTSGFIPDLIMSLQRQQAQIEKLQARIDDLIGMKYTRASAQ